MAAPSRKVPELGLGAAAFGALLLIAFALPSHVLAHEAHPPAQPARAAALDAANAEGAPSLRKGPWPIRNGLNYQPTEQELRALYQEDVTPDQAREIDRLYDQLLASNDHRAGWSQVLADPLIDTGRAVLDNAPIVQVQPRASQFLPGSSADQAEQREAKRAAKRLDHVTVNARLSFAAVTASGKGLVGRFRTTTRVVVVRSALRVQPSLIQLDQSVSWSAARD